MRGEEEHLEEASGKLYTKDVVIQDCNAYIKQYLEKNNLLRTCREFLRECDELKLPEPTYLNEGVTIISDDTYGQLLDTFDNMEQEEFFEVWDNTELVPHEESNKVYLKLNFKLHIYFAVQKINHDLEPVAECLQQVRHFFDTEGGSLSDEPEFVHYYAFPYATNPASHPSFKALFQESWSQRLRCDVCDYIQSLRDLCDESILVKIVLVHCGVAAQHQSQDWAHSPTQLNILKNQYSSLLQNHQKLRTEYQKLLSVTSELTAGLENVAQTRQEPGQGQVDWKNILSKCVQLFPELFTSNQLPPPNNDLPALTNVPPPDWSNRDTNVHIPVDMVSPPVHHSPPSQAGNVAVPTDNVKQPQSSYLSDVKLSADKLNYQAIHEELEGHSVRGKLLLMQALRWYLTKSNQHDRLFVVTTFVQHDLLGFEEHHNVSNRVLSCFLPSSANIPYLLQSSLARLVNAMASAKVGRDYLSSYSSLVETMVDCLIFVGGQMEDCTLEMIIATLQKLSLKLGIRRTLLERGLVSWLVKDYLPRKELRIYGLEYSTALLMNLCLHKSGKIQCVPIANNVLDILVRLLVQDLKQINPYVNGALYSLLGNKDINDVAQSMGIENKIIEKCQDCEEETKKQLEYILDQLRSPDTSEESSIISDDESDDIIDEDIDIEEEIDESDPVLARNDEMSGFVLLEQKYFSRPPEILQQENRVCNNPDFVNPDDRPIRPKTGRYEVIEEVDEEKDSSYCSNTSNRPKSKTKREKDKENANKKNGSKMKETEKSISIESSFETEEREVLTETDNNSSNWITESEMTVTQNNEDSSNLVTTTTEYTSDEIKEDDVDAAVRDVEGSLNELNSITDTYTVVSESDDNQVIVVPNQHLPMQSQEKGEGTTKNVFKQEKIKKSKDVESKTERSRGNIPNSTGSKPYLRSHSGSWKNLRKRRQSKSDKISASLPSEKPFQPNLSYNKDHTKPKENNIKQVELPQLVEDSSSSNPCPESSSLPPVPVLSSSASLQSVTLPASTGRISRSIENVISKLDRRSMSVLPQIGKMSPEVDEKCQTTVNSRASSADRGAEKRTISMTFPYTPLSQIEGQLTLTPPSPRKRWKKVAPGQGGGQGQIWPSPSLSSLSSMSASATQH